MADEVFTCDIYEQILLRVSCVKDLIRFKSVCKSWYSLISDSRFGRNNLLYHNNNRKKNHITRYGRIYIIPYTVCKSSGVLLADKCCHIIGSSNGLVCVKRSRSEFLVVNPITKEVKELQKPIIHNNMIKPFVCCGFGYDSSIDDYKLVLGFKKDDGICFQVLSLRSNVFKVIGYVKYMPIGKSRVGTLCNGALHWFMEDYQNNKVVILSFDLSKEKFKEILQPDDRRYGYTTDAKLGVIEQHCLCIFRPYIPYKWIMRNDNVKQSWKPIWFSKDNDCSNYLRGLWIGLSIPDDHRHIIFSTSSNIGSPVYVGSLVSPHDVNNGTLKRKRHAMDSNIIRKAARGL